VSRNRRDLLAQTRVQLHNNKQMLRLKLRRLLLLLLKPARVEYLQVLPLVQAVGVSANRESQASISWIFFSTITLENSSR